MAKTKQSREYEAVPGDPVKSFFVQMLTRDISLSDSILDLIDNCIDGVLRSKKAGRKNVKQPFKGYYAKISYDDSTFEISDNCGGIPWELREYAFRMGRAGPQRDADKPTVGVYGIGMKRAIFKIGQHTLIHTQDRKEPYDVEIEPSWLTDESSWAIPVRPSKTKMEEDGTTIVISDLHDGVSDLFTSDKQLFDKELRDKVSTHYAFIIKKGFSIQINGVEVKPKPTELRFDESASKAGIRPFIYKTKIGDVEVFLAVGFTHPIPSDQDIEEEQENNQYTSIDAGLLC